jgi:hypothetical protein
MTATTGKQFAALVREIFRIGTRTRANRETYGTKRRTQILISYDRDDLTTDILGYVTETVFERNAQPSEERDIVRAAWGAVCAWEKHIKTGRAGFSQCRYLKSLSPYQFTKLLGEMVDAGITNTGQGEQWFRARRDADNAACEAKFRY